MSFCKKHFSDGQKKKFKFMDAQRRGIKIMWLLCDEYLIWLWFVVCGCVQHDMRLLASHTASCRSLKKSLHNCLETREERRHLAGDSRQKGSAQSKSKVYAIFATQKSQQQQAQPMTMKNLIQTHFICADAAKQPTDWDRAFLWWLKQIDLFV